ncbi:MAG: methionyl-tRNA formyltransferase [Tissierellia bacterium]|nr:methionyl-tRNA formyltransferase [Tissierellia bacterium]
MNKIKTIFFGTPDFSVPALEVLHELTDLRLVVTQEDKPKGRGKKVLASPVKARALELGIEVFQPSSINTQESQAKLEALGADLFVVVAYGQILKKPVLEAPKLDIINIHASLLPKYRGAAPIERAILEGERETGVSIMRVEEGLDSGPVALMKSCPIGHKNAQDLREALADLGAQALRDYLGALEEGRVSFKDQDHDQATYAHKIHNELGALDFLGETSQESLNRIRALSPKPGAYFYLEGEKIKVFEGALAPQEEGGEPGDLRVRGPRLFIRAKDGFLEVKSLQRPGKKRMDVASFLNGYPIKEGSQVN